MADEKSEWGEAGQPAEGGELKDDRRPPRPSRRTGDQDQSRPPQAGDRGSESGDQSGGRG
jgi:hypothetical protein